MSKGFLPQADAEFLAYVKNFDAVIASASPTAYPLSEAQKTQLASEVGAFQQAYTLAYEPSTRTSVTVGEKNAVKKRLEALVRQYAGMIQKAPTTSDTQRRELKINVPKPRHARPAPGDWPRTDVESVVGRTVTLRFHDGTASKARGPDVAGVTVFYHLGETPPADASGWQFMTNSSAMKVELTFAPSQAADTVWTTAFFYNARGESGPASEPTRINLPAASVAPAQAAANGMAKRAA